MNSPLEKEENLPQKTHKIHPPLSILPPPPKKKQEKRNQLIVSLNVRIMGFVYLPCLGRWDGPNFKGIQVACGLRGWGVGIQDLWMNQASSFQKASGSIRPYFLWGGMCFIELLGGFRFSMKQMLSWAEWKTTWHDSDAEMILAGHGRTFWWTIEKL